MTAADLPHGRSRYLSYGCRCDVCKEANRVYTNEYRASDPPAYQRTVARQKIRNQAMRILAKRHPDELEQIIEGLS